ncbi:hypothetical protein AAY72_01505 [Alishewanella sp. WH16-1]|uniref:DUF4124 domain-containing protein n=1 Tax=Alishewanella sp. WH16-1 TaxID=1651088 RepID=UPI00070FB30D|nr:DUF4124 domain-containing protein [Alishewanella sp. WH16-1]KRS22817.1 hypothetical protein AAY72_01505 [Alishewanella sp. WH16-1]
MSLSLIFTLLLSGPVQVYKCDFNGTVIYSQQPCGDNSEKVEVKAVPKMSGSANANQTAKPAVSEFDQISLNIKKRNLNIEFTRLNARKERLLRERDAELAKLKAKKRRSANNLAGATWEESISTEMAAVVKKYETDINELNREIDKLKTEIDSLD